MEKYIVNDSPYEINIPYKLKKRMVVDYKNIELLNEDRLRHLFDEPIQKLLLLIQQSLLRFVQTHQYREIEKELARDIEDMGFEPQMEQSNNISSLQPESSLPFSPSTIELQESESV